MQKEESLSAFMDGHDIDSGFIDTLCSSSELKQKWTNYHAIRNTMRGDALILGADFSAKMELLLENEEIDSSSASNIVETEKAKGTLLKLKRWSTPLMQAGIAASVCLIAVFSINSMNTSDDLAATQPVLQTQPFTESIKPVSYNAPEKESESGKQSNRLSNADSSNTVTEEEKVKDPISSKELSDIQK